MATAINTSPELWAGIECTINRVGSQYFKQLERNGHLYRLSDLDLFASLGIKKIRYPVLWEQLAATDGGKINWDWADERLHRLRELNICPIIGFVHHGSGPEHTSLTDPAFPHKLAAYAGEFASRYPWVKYFTPVNEPLTTARFSGLYGHWYPHGRDNATFIKCLMIQCEAIARSMNAIRSHIPDALLVQTEDICKITSTPLLAYQADYENERRWLSLDLLCGAVGTSHKLWNMLDDAGIDRNILQWLNEHPCPPDIIGVNHYLNSNRFLDENWQQYPVHYHGGNDLHKYADIEAVSVAAAVPVTLHTLLKEVWERYHLPIAVTEAHLCSTREEQLRWLQEFWDTAALLRDEQVDIKAVTAWALLGSYDWNSLVTRNTGFYESGVYDMRDGTPRPTAIADMMASFARNQAFKHPVLAARGYWHRNREPHNNETPGTTAPILIISGNNTTGEAFARRCRERAIHCQVTGSDAAIQQYKPWAVIHCSGDISPAVTTTCKNAGIQLLCIDTGNIAADILRENPSALIIKTGVLFNPWDAQDTFATALRSMLNGQVTTMPGDIKYSFTYVPDLADHVLDLLIDRDSGTRLLVHEGIATIASIMQLMAANTGLDPSLISTGTSQEGAYAGVTPQDGNKFMLPPLTDAIARYCKELHFSNNKYTV